MCSEEDWTHHWLTTSMGPSGSDTPEDDALNIPPTSGFINDYRLEDLALIDDPLGMAQIQAPEECISTSPVTSLDLDRDSPMGGLDDDDAGPPSIETQPPDNSDFEVSGITSTWISSGGHYGGNHPGLSYSILKSDMPPTAADSTEETPPLPGVEDPFDSLTHTLLHGPPPRVNTPARDSSPLNYGDIADDGATSGLCGLRNLGNTCFMAAGLQCLVNTPPIAQYFFNHHLESEEAKRSLAGCFSQLTHKIWSGKYSSLRPAEFKEAFGSHWRDFRDYRQHDCQEFMTLLLEALRKQMPLEEDEEGEGAMSTAPRTQKNLLSANSSTSSHSMGRAPSCTASSVSSRSSSSQLGGSSVSRGSLSPSPPQSPPPGGQSSPLSSPGSTKHPSFDIRSDIMMHEDPVGLDSGAASPKSSISSSSVDAHLISLRLQPIPEEVKTLNRGLGMHTSSDDISIAGTVSCHDAESVTSDISDSCDGAAGGSGVAAVRRYNHLASSPNVCDISVAEAVSTTSHLPDICDNPSTSSSSSNGTQRDEFQSDLQFPSTSSANKDEMSLDKCGRGANNHHLSMVKLEDIMKETKTSNVNVLAKDNVPNNEFLYDSEKYAKFESKKLKNSVDNLSRSGLKRVKEVNILVDKMDNSQLDSYSLMSSSKPNAHKGFSAGRNSIVALNKRIRLEEKNVQYEIEKSHTDYYGGLSEGFPSTSPSMHERHKAGGAQSSPTVSSEEQRMADESWKAFVGERKSAVVDTFYGQFKSSLVCSVCGHTSIKFDPFGTLSVPLPHANEIQIPVIYVPYDGSTPTRFLITLFKVSTVLELKTALLKLISETADKNSVINEPTDNNSVTTEATDKNLVTTGESTDKNLVNNEAMDKNLVTTDQTDKNLVTAEPTDKNSVIKEVTDKNLVNNEATDKNSVINEATDKNLAITEVFDNHIARTVEENYLTKFLNFPMRNIYAFELGATPCGEDKEPGRQGESSVKREVTIGPQMKPEHEFMGQVSGCAPPPPSVAAEWQPCNICLEELCQTDLKTHESCEDCVLCDNCIEMSVKHHGGGALPCPVCHTLLRPTDLIPVDRRKAHKPTARILRVPVVFRVDTLSDDNNKREIQLVGHPALLSLPSHIHMDTLTCIVQTRLLVDRAWDKEFKEFSLLLVDGRGYNCSRCLFSSHCRGCEACKEGPNIRLQAGDTLCVRFTAVAPEHRDALARLQDHPSMAAMRPNEPLTLYDCLRAFTQSETLEDSELWFCPKCERKQRATKTISVWKYPPYLIIHLERFLFHGTVSTKVDDKVLFPIDGLSLSDFAERDAEREGERANPLLYNLYSCVCHMGVAQAGHYTALVRSPVTGDWHYFNDDCVTRQKPRDEEYSSSYLLFYHRQGTKFDLCLPKHLSSFTPTAGAKEGEREIEVDEMLVGSSSDSKHVPSLPCSSFVHTTDNNAYRVDTNADAGYSMDTKTDCVYPMDTKMDSAFSMDTKAGCATNSAYFMDTKTDTGYSMDTMDTKPGSACSMDTNTGSAYSMDTKANTAYSVDTNTECVFPMDTLPPASEEPEASTSEVAEY